MKISQKLLIGFLAISFLTLAVSYVAGVLVQEDTMNNFQEVGGEILPGSIALANMTTELYRVLELVSRFADKGDIEDKQKIEKALSTLNTYKTMHVLYHKGDEAWHEQIDKFVQKFTSYITEYLLLIHRGGGRRAEKSKVQD